MKPDSSTPLRVDSEIGLAALDDFAPELLGDAVRSFLLHCRVALRLPLTSPAAPDMALLESVEAEG